MRVIIESNTYEKVLQDRVNVILGEYDSSEITDIRYSTSGTQYSACYSAMIIVDTDKNIK